MNFSFNKNLPAFDTISTRRNVADLSDPITPPSTEVDTRFAQILGRGAWSSLPETIQHRFSKRIKSDCAKLYRGHVRYTDLSRLGWCFAQVTRLVGGPLPLSSHAGRATVLVHEDPEINGQIWQRNYERPGRFPQVIHSAKRFCGPTGIEEYIGYGIGMSLRLAVEDQALTFTSEAYFFEVAGYRFRWPTLLAPGVMKIVHKDEAPNTFSFALTLDHPVFGRLLEQVVDFRDEDDGVQRNARSALA